MKTAKKNKTAADIYKEIKNIIMSIQYQIFELDSNHLKRHEGLHEDKDRICFLEANLGQGTHFWSFEEAFEYLERNGDDYKEYTIIPRIYLTR